MAKQINARVLLKHDTVANWEKIHGSFVPMRGEMIVYDDFEPIWQKNPDGTYVTDSEGNKIQKLIEDDLGDLVPSFRQGVKIGTGNAYLCDLPFVQVTPEMKEFWNNKLNVDDSPEGSQYMADTETLIFNRN